MTQTTKTNDAIEFLTGFFGLAWSRIDGQMHSHPDDEFLYLSDALGESNDVDNITHPNDPDCVRHQFSDGSAIIMTSAAWDLAAHDDMEDCFCWMEAHEGRHGSECPHSKK